uniref:Uncharacterized protein n=1 Tax=viral metagenome TaxID=1070528 RepID=A0A6C0HS32_9ZZZZ
MSNDDFTIPTVKNYTECNLGKYSLKNLKIISKKYKLKTSLKKEFLIKNITSFLVKEIKAIKIQSMIRRWFVNEWVNSHGPKYRNCVNETDFLTIEPLSDIPFKQYFAYEEKDCHFSHIYGFDIVSINTLLKTNGNNATNPYNRKKFDQNILKKFDKLTRLSKLLDINIVTEIKEEFVVKTFEAKCLDLFQKINELGHYSNHLWFLELQKRHLIKFARDLYDIWFYRCQLTPEVQRNISPRGSPFRHINIYYLQDNTERELKEKILRIMEDFVYYGTSTDNKNLGAYYILGALTITNRNAANALPWLFETFI